MNKLDKQLTEGPRALARSELDDGADATYVTAATLQARQLATRVQNRALQGGPAGRRTSSSSSRPAADADLRPPLDPREA